jgi:hypothetical protein
VSESFLIGISVGITDPDCVEVWFVELIELFCYVSLLSVFVELFGVLFYPSLVREVVFFNVSFLFAVCVWFNAALLLVGAWTGLSVDYDVGITGCWGKIDWMQLLLLFKVNPYLQIHVLLTLS